MLREKKMPSPKCSVLNHPAIFHSPLDGVISLFELSFLNIYRKDFTPAEF